MRSHIQHTRYWQIAHTVNTVFCSTRHSMALTCCAWLCDVPTAATPSGEHESPPLSTETGDDCGDDCVVASGSDCAYVVADGACLSLTGDAASSSVDDESTSLDSASSSVDDESTSLDSAPFTHDAASMTSARVLVTSC